MARDELRKNEIIYFQSLCRMIKEHLHRPKYGDLCYWLFNEGFYAYIPNDDNRVADGLKLRNDFGIDLGEEPCSVLEMLIGLAERMDYELFDTVAGKRVDRWFWMLIENLDFDYVEFGKEASERNNDILRRFINRRYGRNGEGGAFPLRKSRTDQRKVELWYQMQAYIQEFMEG